METIQGRNCNEEMRKQSSEQSRQGRAEQCLAELRQDYCSLSRIYSISESDVGSAPSAGAGAPRAQRNTNAPAAKPAKAQKITAEPRRCESTLPTEEMASVTSALLAYP